MNVVESMKQKGTGRPRRRVTMMSKRAIVIAMEIPPGLEETLVREPYTQNSSVFSSGALSVSHSQKVKKIVEEIHDGIQGHEDVADKDG
jgi:hypothetical protein